MPRKGDLDQVRGVLTVHAHAIYYNLEFEPYFKYHQKGFGDVEEGALLKSLGFICSLVTNYVDKKECYQWRTQAMKIR